MIYPPEDSKNKKRKQYVMQRKNNGISADKFSKRNKNMCLQILENGACQLVNEEITES